MMPGLVPHSADRRCIAGDHGRLTWLVAELWWTVL